MDVKSVGRKKAEKAAGNNKGEEKKIAALTMSQARNKNKRHKHEKEVRRQKARMR